MIGLPGAPRDDEDIEITWERKGDSTKVSATLRKTKVTVKTKSNDADTVPWLLAAMPQVLEAAWASIENAKEAP